MDSTTLEKAAKVLRQHGLDVIGAILKRIMIRSVVVFGLIFLIDRKDGLLTGTFAGVFVAVILLIQSLNSIEYAVETFRTASYVGKHSMDILYVNAESYSRTLFSYLEGGRFHFKDKASYILDGTLHKTGIYKMLRDDCENKSLMVFRDREQPDVVFAVPAIYMRNFTDTMDDANNILHSDLDT